MLARSECSDMPFQRLVGAWWTKQPVGPDHQRSGQRSGQRCIECHYQCLISIPAPNGKVYCDHCWKNWPGSENSVAAGPEQARCWECNKDLPEGWDCWEADDGGKYCPECCL